MLSVVYTTTKSNNCGDFVKKLDYSVTHELVDPKVYPKGDFILITGTYADAHGRGSLHPNVVELLTDPYALKSLKGVASSGNRVFGKKFALSGKIIAHTLDIPLIRCFELKGLPSDVKAVRAFIDDYNKREIKHD